MKRIITIIFALFIVAAANQVQAQKFGHVNYAEVMKVMPGIDSAQTAIVAFQKELQEVGEMMANEFKIKQAELEKFAASSNASQAVLKIKQEELMGLYERIQNYSASIESELTAKQTELLEPFQKKLLEVIEEVATAEKYTYIFDVSTLSFYGESTDLTPVIKTKLGIK